MSKGKKEDVFFKKRVTEGSEELQNSIVREAVQNSGVDGAIVIMCRANLDGGVSIQPLTMGLKKEVILSMLKDTIRIIKIQIDASNKLIKNETVN